jgi:hypothetical protein
MSPSKFPNRKAWSMAVNLPQPEARDLTYLLCVTASNSKMLKSQLSSLSSNWAMEGGTSLMVIGIGRWLWLWCTSEQTDGVGGWLVVESWVLPIICHQVHGCYYKVLHFPRQEDTKGLLLFHENSRPLYWKIMQFNFLFKCRQSCNSYSNILREVILIRRPRFKRRQQRCINSMRSTGSNGKVLPES